MEIIQQQLIQNQSYLLISVFVLSLLVGSFLNVVIYRLPIMIENEQKILCSKLLHTNLITPQVFNLSFPRSACPKCGHQISAIENIPIISYLYLKGKCRECKTPISIQYPLIELLTAVLSILVAIEYGYSWQLLAAIIFTWLLIALTLIDFKTFMLPDVLSLSLLWLGLLANTKGLFVDLNSAIFGAIFGYLSLYIVNYLYILVRKKPGIGHGDFKLLAAIGAWGGWQVLSDTLLLATIMGIAYFVIQLIFTKQRQDEPIPFGPFLAIAAWILIIY